MPTQWIAKQYTELLGRAPTQSEWSSWLSHYAPLECNYDDVTALTRQLAVSSEFQANYPQATALEKSARFLALTRAAFSHDPNATDWDNHFVPYRDGTATWVQTVDSVLADGFFMTFILPYQVCNQYEAGYGFRDSAPLLDRRQLVGLGASRTQQQLQAAIDSAAPPNMTVSLQPGELVLIGGATNNNQGLVVRAGVTLTTSGSPGPSRYALMGRLVPAGPDALICDESSCNNSAVVRLEAGARIRNVWVGGSGTWDSGAAFEENYKVANIESWGSSAAASTLIRNNRVSDPGRDGTAIRAYGFSVTGQACENQEISGNLVTGYASLHSPDRAGQARWVDGIAVHCESATVDANQIVDVSDAAIMLYGSYNRELDAGATQRSQVTNNTILSAGLSAKVALGADPIGVCRAVKDMRNPGMSAVAEQQANTYLLTGEIPGYDPLPPMLPCTSACEQSCRIPEQCIPWTWPELTNAFPDCGVDPADECAYVNDGVIIPCIDLPHHRSFDGAVVSGNVFTTNPRTHFDIGLMIGGSPRWGDHRIFGGCPSAGCSAGGVAFTNNTTGSVGAQAVTGISVAGMFDVLLTGNTGTYTTGDPNPGVMWQKCPQVAVAVASSEFASLQTGSQSHVQTDDMVGCDTDEPPIFWLAPIVLAADGTTLAQDLNEDGVPDRRFYPWGFNYNYNTGEPNPTGEPYEWNDLVRTFRSMRRMGANIVRIGPTFQQILEPPSVGFPYGTPKQQGLDWLSNLLSLAQQTNIYVDLSYVFNQDPDWFLQADEDTRWGAMAHWWSLVAGVAKPSTAVAWYSLKNEPIVPGACTCKQSLEPCNGDCCTANPSEHGSNCPFVDCPVAAGWVGDLFNDFLALSRCDANGQERTALQIVQGWLDRMRTAIRSTENGGAGDTAHLLAIADLGFAGIEPAQIADRQDLVLSHFYPADSAAVVRVAPPNEFQNYLFKARTFYNTGQPHIVEEAFVLAGTQIAMEAFLLQARPGVSGFVTHYLGSKSPTAVSPSAGFADFATLATYQIMLRNLALFQPSGTGTIQP